MAGNIEECSLEDLVKKGTVEAVAKKLEITPVILDDENYHDYSLIITALRNTNITVVKFLIDKGFRIYKKSKSQPEKTPLHYALELGELQLLFVILSKGAVLDLATIDENGESPLDITINNKETSILRALVSYAEVETLDNMYLLHYSIQNHNIELLKVFIDRGLSPVKKNMNNETAFCVAIKENHLDAICLLWESYKGSIKYKPNNNNLLGLLFVTTIINDIEGLIDIVESGNGYTFNTTVKPCNDGWSLFEYFNGYSLLHCAIKYIEQDVINFLLENLADVTIRDATGSTPFHIALEVKEKYEKGSVHYKINEQIIDSLFCAIDGEYVNYVNKYGISHFHLVCTQNKPKMVRYFLENGASVSDSVNLNSPIYKGFSPLHFATKYICKRTVEILLEAGADIDQEAHFKTTPLHIASNQESLQMVKFLIKHGADITKQDSFGNTPVHYAFEAKNYEMLDLLLSVHAIITANPVNYIGISHFHIACTRNDISMIASFLENGASVNDFVSIDPNIQYLNHDDDIDWHGCSPLHFAAAFNRVEIAQFLIDEKACIEVSDARGFTPFHMACQYTCEKFDELVKDNSINGGIYEEMARQHKLYADNFGDVTAMENEFKACYPHELSDGWDQKEATIIDWSSNRKDHVNIVTLFIDNNCDVNKVDIFGNGPLFYMCYLNLNKILSRVSNSLHCTLVVQMLLFRSFLNELCYRRQVLVHCLLKRTVNMEKCYNNGSILHYLSVNREYGDAGRVEVMEVLLNSGANVNATDEKMQTPLHLAAQVKDRGVIEILLKYNANVNCVESQNLATPLHIATSLFGQDSLQIVYLLSSSGANVNAKQLDGRTPLHNLLSKPCDYDTELRPIFYHFLSLGVDLNVPDNAGQTPLFVACTIVNCEIVEDLLKFGADVTVEDCNGMNIYQFVYSQIKSIFIAYKKLSDDLYEVFWILLKHAVKLDILQLFSCEKILQIWYDLKKMIKPLQVQNEDLDRLMSSCHQEIEIFRNTKIHNNITMHDLLFQEDHEMTKYINNDLLKAIIESDTFDEAYECYGYLLKVKFRNGFERNKLLPAAKQSLSYLTSKRLPENLSEDILRHLNNSAIKQFINAMSTITSDKTTSIDPTPIKIIRDSIKYSRLA